MTKLRNRFSYQIKFFTFWGLHLSTLRQILRIYVKGFSWSENHYLPTTQTTPTTTTTTAAKTTTPETAASRSKMILFHRSDGISTCQTDQVHVLCFCWQDGWSDLENTLHIQATSNIRNFELRCQQHKHKQKLTQTELPSYFRRLANHNYFASSM